jgi:hypothetical protein
MEVTMEEFYEEICAEIVKILDERPDVPMEEVTREVAMGMLLGEDEETKDAIMRKLGI